MLPCKKLSTGESSSSTTATTDESCCSNIIGESEYKPDVPEEYIPVVGTTFKSLALAIDMYTDYAERAGFDTRLYSQSKFKNNIVRKKYVICNRGGKDTSNPFNTLAAGEKKRKQNANKLTKGCKAQIVIHIVPGTTDYYIKQFWECHNHPLESPEDRCHLKRVRKMSFAEREYQLRASRAALGPQRAHRLRAILKGGYQYVGAKVSDYKNFRRGLCRILYYKDAQIMVNKMNDRREHFPNYSFEYMRDRGHLAAMFWADEREKAFYAEFGEVISFDATFRTNK